MTIHPLIGHHEARRQIARAIRDHRLPHVILVTGPEGVGKQRFGLWVAQRLLCEHPGDVEPCGECRTCHLVLSLGHPDVHWFVPIPVPKAAEPDKQVEEAAETLADVMNERRAKPLYPRPDGMAAHSMASARLLQRRASLTPVEGRWKVFLVGDAERLVPQESSPHAANALLKLLEEPPADTIFLLTAADRQALLPTIVSRAVPLRLHRLADDEVRAFLAERLHPPLTGRELDARVEQARGVIGRVILGEPGDAKARQSAQALLEAVAAGRGPRLERALQQGAWQARGEFSTMLDALSDVLSQAAREAAQGRPAAALPPALRRRSHPLRLARALERVAAAREAAQGNVNPQLLLAVLGEELAEAL